MLVVRLGGRKEFSSRNQRIVLRFVLQTDREDLAVKSHRTANRSVLKELAEREGSSFGPYLQVTVDPTLAPQYPVFEGLQASPIIGYCSC